MAQLKDIFKVTQSQYDTLVNGGTVGSHTYDSNAIYLVEGSGTQNITYNFAKGYDGFTVTPSEGTPQTVSVESTRLLRLDTRNKNPNPYAADNYAGYTTVHLKTNSTIGINDEGTYSALMQIYPWGDNTGGSAHQLAYGTNGGIYHRYGTDNWSTWSRLATQEWVTDQLDDVDVDLSNYVTLNGTQTITGTKTFSTHIKTAENTMGIKLRTHDNYETGWVYGTTGNESVTLAIQNPVTAFQIVYGTKPSAFTSSTWQTVTPLFQTKDGKVIINRKITATADTTNLKLLDVNGDIAAITINSEKYAITSGSTTKATWQYNSSTDCVELVW